MNVLFFTNSLGSGGAEMHLLRLLNYLDRDQFDPSVALMKKGGTYEKALKSDVPVHHLPTGNIDVHKLRQLRAVKPLRALIRAKRPDVVCAVMDSASVVATQALRGCPESPRLVLSVQIPPLVDYQQAKQHQKWHRVLYIRMMLKLFRYTYEKADRIVAISSGVAEDVVALAPAVAERTKVIHNAGLDDEMRDRAADPIKRSTNELLIVGCGRLTKQKGFSYLLDAFAEVRNHFSARLIILGEGPLRGELEAQVRRLGLADVVELPGFQDNPFKYMAAADLFVLSSLFEGFGNVVAEAMACGTPVVTTDCPHGPGEIVEGGESGVLVPPADTDALADAIQRILADDARREQLATAGQARAQDFHARVVAEKYGQLFQELVPKAT